MENVMLYTVRLSLMLWLMKFMACSGPCDSWGICDKCGVEAEIYELESRKIWYKT
jgi:hypothetical protein